MSSRNNYLTPAERKLAPMIYEALCNTRDRVRRHGSVTKEAEAAAMESLNLHGFRPDYVSIRRQKDLARPQPEDNQLIILTAAWLGKTRLIDNLEFDVNAVI